MFWLGVEGEFVMDGVGILFFDVDYVVEDEVDWCVVDD